MAHPHVSDSWLLMIRSSNSMRQKALGASKSIQQHQRVALTPYHCHLLLILQSLKSILPRKIRDLWTLLMLANAFRLTDTYGVFTQQCMSDQSFDLDRTLLIGSLMMASIRESPFLQIRLSTIDHSNADSSLACETVTNGPPGIGGSTPPWICAKQ